MSPKKYVVMAKVEVTQFTDVVPTDSANAILCSNLRLTPLRVESEDRGIMRPYYGNSEQIPVKEEAVVEFDVEIAGSGAAGTAPAWGVLLKGCSFAETVTALTDVQYDLVSTGFQYLTLYVNRDGRLSKLLGAHGTVSFDFAAGKLPHMHFRFVGKYAAVSDVALPASPDYSAFVTPKAAIPSNAGTLTIDSYAAKCAAALFDIANDVSHALWINLETLSPVDRKPRGKLTLESVLVATKNYFTLIRDASLVAWTYTHGTVAGNKVTVDAPKVQLVDHAEEEFESNMADGFNITLNPNTGNDELKITVL